MFNRNQTISHLFPLSYNEISEQIKMSINYKLLFKLYFTFINVFKRYSNLATIHQLCFFYTYPSHGK